jgi:hypothetical protein
LGLAVFAPFGAEEEGLGVHWGTSRVAVSPSASVVVVTAMRVGVGSGIVNVVVTPSNRVVVTSTNGVSDGMARTVDSPSLRVVVTEGTIAVKVKSKEVVCPLDRVALISAR